MMPPLVVNPSFTCLPFRPQQIAPKKYHRVQIFVPPMLWTLHALNNTAHMQGRGLQVGHPQRRVFLPEGRPWTPRRRILQGFLRPRQLDAYCRPGVEAPVSRGHPTRARDRQATLTPRKSHSESNRSPPLSIAFCWKKSYILLPPPHEKNSWSRCCILGGEKITHS